MREAARIPLPPHGPDGEFDHAAVDPIDDRLYVAHPSNDAVEIVDLGTRRHRASIPGLRGVAGVWVDAPARLLFTSNRGEDTASIFRLDPDGATELFRVPTGARPNGMAYDPLRSVLMIAGVGKANVPGAPPTLTFVDVRNRKSLGRIEAPGRTRWALYHPATDSFYVNVACPPMVVAVRAREISRISQTYAVPSKGPHGLEQDPAGDVLYCACDEGVLLTLDLGTGISRVAAHLAGPPDVLWLSRRRARLYGAVGEPGSVEVFDVNPLRASARVATSDGAHTLTVDERRDEVHVFLPASHEDLVLEDRTG
jgi:DNA-binding beta-propeller fold protein YncE